MPPFDDPNRRLPETLPDGTSRHDARDPDLPVEVDDDLDTVPADDLAETGDPGNVDSDTVPFDIGDDSTDAALF